MKKKTKPWLYIVTKAKGVMFFSLRRQEEYFRLFFFVFFWGFFVLLQHHFKSFHFIPLQEVCVVNHTLYHTKRWGHLPWPHRSQRKWRRTICLWT